MKTDILIIGGGLAGLTLAERLHAQSRDFHIVEARDRLGGRILTHQVGEAHFDLGPTWFWRGQPRIDALVERLGLARFEQFSAGHQLYEDERGQVHRGPGHAAMQGSFRLQGGLGRLITALADEIPRDRVHLSMPVTRLTRQPAGVAAETTSGDLIKANRVIMTAPPRVAADVRYAPALPAAKLSAMRTIPTWMAGQAKAVAIYEQPFWRDEGLSGDAMSRRGPMVEIHDASPETGGPAALFGFIGIPPQARLDEGQVSNQVTDQFTRLFGQQAASPIALHIKDWAKDRYTATPADAAPVYAHPTYHKPAALKDMWGGRLLFSGTEMASQFGGYLEGALESAENVLAEPGCNLVENDHGI